MNPLQIIEKYYKKNTPLYEILISHSEAVAEKALKIIETQNIAETHNVGARHALPLLRQNIDKNFVQEAAMLHDIGIFLTNAPSIHCFGTHNYIEHGYLGAEILRAENLPKHALVCERHTGTGLTVQDIINKKLPLPLRDMQPISIEEQLICYADLFFAKTGHFISLRKGMSISEEPIEKIRQKVAAWGENSVEKFEYWLKIFGQ